MTKKEEGLASNMSTIHDNSKLRDDHSADSDKKIPDDFDTASSKRQKDVEKEEELDEFGLPIPKIVINSRPPSSCSESFTSARSSIDEDIHDTHHDDENADVEDNDVEENNETSNPAMEWPRLSRSTLPATGHVKSSPFHAAPPKPPEKQTIYADRAKELVKVSPVSNSIFKRQGSPIEGSSSRSTSFPDKSEPPKSPHKESRSQAQSPEQTSHVTTMENTPEISSTENPTEVKSEATISKDVSHSRESSTVLFEDPNEFALNPSGASQWSHQLGVIQAESHEKTRKSIDTDGWQIMPAFATYDVYDDDDRLVAKQFDESDDGEQAKGGAGKGYTRMNQDEDAQSADSMDENTQYLFTESLHDEDAKTPLSQMQATKELLTEGQRIAYVGLCKLTMVGMLRDVGRVRFKENRAAYESMTLWSQKMIIRLFIHMDISPAGCVPRNRADDRTSYD